MRELPKQSNLHRRNGRYYIRVRVPKDLVSTLNKNEIKYSLGTSDRTEAMQRLSLEMVKVQQLFTKERRNAENQQSPDTDKPNITRTEIERAVLLWHQQAINKAEQQIDDFRVGADEFELEEVRQTLREELSALESGNDNQYGRAVHTSVKKAFSGAGLKPPKSPESRDYAYSLVHQGLIEQSHHSLERYGESYNRQPFGFFLTRNVGLPTSPQAQSSTLSVSALFDKFRDAKTRDGMTVKTLNGYRLTFAFALELFGENRNITTITPEDCRDYRDKLSTVPSNAKKRYPHLSLLEASKANQDETRRLKPASINGHLQNLSAIFNFATREGYLDKNPASHITHIKDNTSSSREPFTIEELNIIFNAPLYTGCKDDERNYRNPGPNKPRRHRFWIPLISLFTGMRLNEICQLFTEDIKQDNGIHYFDINVDEEGEKRVKTEQSKRKIPVHEELINIGFINYVEQIKKRGEKRLFPDMSCSTRESYSDNFSKWNNRFLTSLGVKRKEVCFHSFRHTFTDAMRETMAHKDISLGLGGWKVSDSTMEVYGLGYKLETLNKAVQKVHYDKLNLTHLRPESD